MADDMTTPEKGTVPLTASRGQPPFPDAADNRKMVKATAGIGVLTAAGFLTGIVTKMILSRLLGTEATANAYNYVYRLTQDVFRTWDKLIRPSFLPVLAHERERAGEDDSWHFINSVTSAQAILLAVMTAALMALAQQIVGHLTSFRGEEAALAVRFLVVTSPSVLFLGLAVTGYMLLNSYKRFQLAAFGDQVFVKLAPFIALVMLWWFLGIYALILAVVFGAAAKFALYAWGLRKELRRFHFELRLNTPAMRALGLLLLPLLAGVLVAFLRNRGEDLLLSAVLGGRAMTIVTYSRAPVDIPVTLFPVAMSIAIFPFLSEYFVKKQTEQLFSILGKAIRIIFLVFLPLTVLLTLLAHPLVEVFFGGGKFNAEDVRFTAEALQWYAFGYVFLGLEIVLLQFFYAARETWTPTWTGIFTSLLQLLMLAVAIILLPLEDADPSRRLHMVGAFNLAFSASKVLKVLLLFVLLVRVYPHAHLWGAMLRRSLPGLLKVAAVTAAMGLAVYGLDHFLRTSPTGDRMSAWIAQAVNAVIARVSGLLHHAKIPRLAVEGARDVLRLAMGSCLGLAVFAAGAQALRVEDWLDAVGWVKRKLRRS